MPERTAEQWREQTEETRRSARFKFAQDRIRKIVDGAPPLTPDQRAKLAAIIHGGAGPMARPAEGRRGGDSAA